ncbi:MAG: glycosyltransferase [Chloroflexi bacterium]|nr:glycosyltransferase [Chloroflexota bacterium]
MICLQDGIPRVSVVMAVRDGASYVRQAIDSILDQAFADFEFLIIDDGSTDGTPELLRRAADPRLRVVTQRPLGIPLSLNRGTALARGRYVARQDADDLSSRQRLALEVGFLDRHPDVAMVGSWATVIDDGGHRVLDLTFPVDHETIASTLLERNCFMHGSLLIRRQCLLEIGGYRPDFPVASDYDLYLRLTERFRVANIPRILYQYRRTKASISWRMAGAQSRYVEVAREQARQRRRTAHAASPRLWTPAVRDPGTG